MEITPDKLVFYNTDMDFVVETDGFAIMVGCSSREQDLHSVVLKVD